MMVETVPRAIFSAMKPLSSKLTLCLAVAALTVAVGLARPGDAMSAAESAENSAHQFEFTAIDGAPLAMSGYAGKAVLVVNTASQCGFTPQYEALQSLWQDYRDRGLVVLGVPSNDFGGQEPGDEAAIKQFCEVNFGIDFPMTEKQTVIGDDAHPFYRWIAAEVGEDWLPRWNFHKYLIAPDGSLAGSWPSRVEPTSAEIRQAIDTSLADR